MQLTFEVPVKPHLKKYLAAKFGANYRLNRSDAIGILLFQMLRRPQTDLRLDKRLSKCTEKFRIDVSAFSFFKKGCRNLDSYTIKEFNNFVEDIILAEFYAFVDNLVSFGLEQKDAIAHFMAKYDFDETDIKFDALKKSYQRYRQRQEANGVQQINGIAFVPYLAALKVFSSQRKTRQAARNFPKNVAKSAA